MHHLTTEDYVRWVKAVFMKTIQNPISNVNSNIALVIPGFLVILENHILNYYSL